ncbi:MAG: antibiotic biosynthesis monooxygenase [Tunicatimonas sp.]|uniref:putative quinol monooxygenase n=1 Tax=Tunicatimonas sp. TaxID=1940096 RepID=UPI003C765BC3
MNKYGLHGKLTATEGNGKKLASILLEASQLVASVQGCHLYLISQDQAHPNDVWITEVWDSQEDHDNSLKDEKVRALITQAMPLLAGKPGSGQVLDVLGGAGID